jgi:prepilin-type N-terminal cleavage/methylation domain-containing protein
MRNRGFSLVELMFVIAIMGVLLAIAIPQFNRYTTKSAMEAQMRIMLTDLMTARSQALYEKKARSVAISAATFAVYSSTATDVAPRQAKTLQYPVVVGSGLVQFDPSGVSLLAPGADNCICLDPSGNPASVDSIVITATRISLGKRNDGSACSTSNIRIQ